MRNFSVPCLSWDANLILNIYQVIVMIVIITGNTFLIIYICGNNGRRFKANILILSLTIADLCAGSIPSTFGLIVSYFSVSQLFCDFYLFFALLFARVASNMIMIISFDRYFRLKYSLQYKIQGASQRPKILAIIFVWIFGISLSVIHIFDSVHNAGNYVKGCFLRASYSRWEQSELLLSIVTPNLIAVILYFKVLIFVRDENMSKIISRALNTHVHNPGSVLRRHEGRYVK